MKSKILILLSLFFHLTSTGQTFHLKIIGTNAPETATIDSIGYTKKHQTTKQLIEEINKINKTLSEIGFIKSKTLETLKENDSSYTSKISLGFKIKHIHIYIGANNQLLEINPITINHDTIIIPFSETEVFLKQTLQNLEKKGYAFTKVKLTNIQQKKHDLLADLKITTDNIRTLNTIEIKYSDPNQKKFFPKGAEKQIQKKYKKKVFNQETVKQIHSDFEEFSFINQIKFPEILFTKDTTKVFVYLQKRKANTFDGYLGFNNTEEKKIRFNGYLDLSLVNTIKIGEELSIFWKNDGNNQKQFNSNLSIPYLFNSPITVKAHINIFKQDSIFQNTKTGLQLGYLIDYNKRIYLGYESTESSDIQNANNQNLSDYKNNFYTSVFEYKKYNTKNKIFLIKSYLNLSIGTGKRANTNSSIHQDFLNFDLMNDFYINNKNIINIKNQNYYLKSKTYLTNELYRFGGTNSIRGFLENSLQGNLMISLMTEYRYLLTQNMYLNSILDYCYYENPIIPQNTGTNKKLLGIGIGTGILTNNGLLKFTIVNGTTDDNKIKFINTILTINYNFQF